MMNFEWDEKKNRENIRKHGISFERAEQIYDGPTFTAESTGQDFGEPRFLSFGLLEGTVLAVVFTPRGAVRRLISARSASRKEREQFHERIKTWREDR
jgi:uncharacterized DUF497 family protein